MNNRYNLANMIENMNDNQLAEYVARACEWDCRNGKCPLGAKEFCMEVQPDEYEVECEGVIRKWIYEDSQLHWSKNPTERFETLEAAVQRINELKPERFELWKNKGGYTLEYQEE